MVTFLAFYCFSDEEISKINFKPSQPSLGSFVQIRGINSRKIHFVEGNELEILQLSLTSDIYKSSKPILHESKLKHKSFRTFWTYDKDTGDTIVARDFYERILLQSNNSEIFQVLKISKKAENGYFYYYLNNLEWVCGKFVKNCMFQNLKTFF